ncbi:hypothetical protein F5Y10DRAFT_287945 [Nemania abortiva]|nr:hypothetical protein F5Y10DRAFT_287945 [Nemania abortiva]
MASLDKDSISILRLHPDPHTARAKEKLLDLVCTHSPDLVHQNLAKTRVKDSGTWLFNLPVFEEWQKTDTVGNADAREGGQSNCIWLNGNVGAGKTMLIIRSALIDHLLASVETLSENKRKKTAVVYYYFDRSLPPSPRDAIASLLRQLCSQTDTGPLPLFLANRLAASRKVSRSNDSASDTITTDSDEEFLAPMPVGDLIADFLSLQLRFDMVYICLDGLEECDDLIALFELLARLVTSPSPSRLAISARPQIVRPGTLANIGSKDMVVNLEQHNAPDIQCYFETHTKKHGYFSDMIGPEALPDYIKTWAEGCRGNFLAATAETVELNRLTTKRDVDRYVDGPNIGFPELFSQIWSRLNDQPPLRATLAKRIFYWLSMSRRTLTLKELQQAIAIEPGEYHSPQVLELDEMLSPPELIEEVCMGFVRVSKVNNSILTHPSALPFYFYQFDASFAEEAREYAAKCCVWFLNIKILSRGSFGTQTEFDKMDQEFPFLRYVSQHWGTHLKHSRGDDMQVVAERLLEDYRLLDAMSQLLYVNRPAPGERRRYDDYPWGFGRKHFEAYFHLEVAFGKQIYPQEWKVRADDEGRKPLHVASISPSLNSRHVLFHTIWDLDDCGREPLVTNEDDSSTEDGSEEFRFELVSTLPWMWDWTSGAIDQLNMRVPFTRKEMITPDKQGKTPLHHFIVEWSEDQLSHLLNTLFDLQEPSNKGNAIRPNTGADEVELLPALADCDGRTILDYACVRSSICVDLVVNTSKWSLENISSAATAAAAGGHLWPLKRLLKLVGSEFEPETLNLGLKTAITEASKRGFTDIIRLICQRGVDISEPEQDEYGMTALHHAAYGGHLETVRYLLTEGADPNRLDKFGETPLFCASKGGSRNVASILISRGADPNKVATERLNLDLAV